MSGSVFSPTLQADSVSTASRSVMRSLGCLTESFSTGDSTTPLTCLRQKPAEDVLRAFESTHKVRVFENVEFLSCFCRMETGLVSWFQSLMPFCPNGCNICPCYRQKPWPWDSSWIFRFSQGHLVTRELFFWVNWGVVGKRRRFKRISVLDRWNDLGTQSESSVLYFINNTAIPNLMRARGLPVKALGSLLEWRYLNNLPGPRLNQLFHVSRLNSECSQSSFIKIQFKKSKCYGIAREKIKSV